MGRVCSWALPPVSAPTEPRRVPRSPKAFGEARPAAPPLRPAGASGGPASAPTPAPSPPRGRARHIRAASAAAATSHRPAGPGTPAGTGGRWGTGRGGAAARAAASRKAALRVAARRARPGLRSGAEGNGGRPGPGLPPLLPPPRGRSTPGAVLARALGPLTCPPAASPRRGA